MKLYPYNKWGHQTNFGHAEGGGGAQSFEVVLTWDTVVLAILKGGTKSIPIKGTIFVTPSRGVRKKIYTHHFPILCLPPSM